MSEEFFDIGDKVMMTRAWCKSEQRDRGMDLNKLLALRGVVIHEDDTAREGVYYGVKWDKTYPELQEIGIVDRRSPPEITDEEYKFALECYQKYGAGIQGDGLTAARKVRKDEYKITKAQLNKLESLSTSYGESNIIGSYGGVGHARESELLKKAINELKAKILHESNMVSENE